MAHQCEQLAKQLTYDLAKKELLEMAREWHRMAEQEDQPRRDGPPAGARDC